MLPNLDLADVEWCFEAWGWKWCRNWGWLSTHFFLVMKSKRGLALNGFNCRPTLFCVIISPFFFPFGTSHFFPSSHHAPFFLLVAYLILTHTPNFLCPYPCFLAAFEFSRLLDWLPWCWLLLVTTCATVFPSPLNCCDLSLRQSIIPLSREVKKCRGGT